jgi:mercuric ion transport protein
MFPPVRRENSPIAMPACAISSTAKKELESVVATDCKTVPTGGRRGDHGRHTSERLTACRRDRSVLLTVTGLAAALGVASCCGWLLLLATAGLGTAWLTSFALLAAPHRAVLLIVGTACLAGGALLLLQQRRLTACTPGTFCSRPAVRGLTLIGLLVGLVLLYLGYAYAWVFK